MALTDEQAADLLQRVTNGANIRSMTQGRGAPFSEWHYKAYCKAKPAFHAAILAASKFNEVARKSANSQRRHRDKTHCKAGHPYTGDNVGHKLSRGKPSRFCRECSRIAAARVRPMTAEQIEKVKTLVAGGVPMWRISQGGDYHVTGAHNIRQQRSVDPEFNRIIGTHIATRTGRAWATRYKTILPPSSEKFDNSVFLSGLGPKDWREIRTAVPRHLPADMREDVAQDVIEALARGTINPAGVAEHIRQFVTAHNIANPSQWMGGRRLVSLDEVRFDGGRSRHDTVSKGLWT